MPDWLSEAVPTTSDLSLAALAVRLTLAVLLGLIIACVYRFSQRRDTSERAALITTMVLLTVLVAMTTLVIGNSIARAFGLVGALSIVRFRTVVDDTRDTAFVIFAVVIGMAVGAGYFAVALIGMPIVSAAAVGLSLLHARTGGGPATQQVEIRLTNGVEPGQLLTDVFLKHLSYVRLSSASIAKHGAALDLHYEVRFRDQVKGPTELLSTLNLLEGVQGVSIRGLA